LSIRQFSSSSLFSNSPPYTSRPLQCLQWALWILRRASREQIRFLQFTNYLPFDMLAWRATTLAPSHRARTRSM
jgi:hypothetical protein